MSLRALILGLLLGVGIAGFTHFNDRVIEQTMLVGNHLPPAVFGPAVLLLFGINPLLRLFGSRWPLRPSETAIILAMGLAVCGWPGTNFSRHFMHLVSLPAHEVNVQPTWQAQEVFSYIPGGSPRLAEGYVADWERLAGELLEAEERLATATGEDGKAGQWIVLGRVWEELGDSGRRAVRQLAESPRDVAARQLLLRRLNEVLGREGLVSRATLASMELPARAGPLLDRFETLDGVDRLALHRAALETAAAGALRPPPAGAGVLLTTDRAGSAALGPLFTGTEQPIGIMQIPWGEWWPVLRLWGGLALLLAAGSLCLVLVVHPQWSRRELLPYPTVHFIEEATRRSLGRSLPDVVFSKMLWGGLALAGGIHLLNGLNAWFEAVPTVSLYFSLQPLAALFPNASRAPGAFAVFHPTIYLSVIGFGFFVATRVSFSLGVSAILWVMLGGAVLARGASFTSNAFSVGGAGPSLRFGAYVGLTAMILYFGRQYYLRAAGAAMGISCKGVDRASVWGLRGLVACAACAVFLLWHYAGLDWPLAVLLVGMIFMALLVLTRVNVETGLYFNIPDWLPGVILLSIFGAAALGPESLLVITLASMVLMGGAREAIMPFLANAWALNDRVGRQPAGRSVSMVGVMLILGFGVALVAMFLIHYNYGFGGDRWPYSTSTRTIQTGATALAELSAVGMLGDVTGNSFAERLAFLQPAPGTMGWALLGLALVLGCSFAALRLPWWPLHPVVFVVWGSYAISLFAVSFLLAALFKKCVITCAGERGYHTLKPFMIGLIAGELLMILFWSGVGVSYYYITNVQPSSPGIAPG